ncbi:MAG: hypothetical protein KatS3mg101_0605 [Patescibacteria group bacterium]|nr:MAG: hypothetical protein KatS3mg101_0605 [Patescibacteria group bacterium]
MCILEAQRQLSKVGLEGALIRVFRNTNLKAGKHRILIGDRPLE